MFRLVAILALFGCAYAGALPGSLEGRIVGGTKTTIEQHPWQVSLQYRNGFHFCGGSLINERFIITAAHCMVGQVAQKIFIRLGSTFNNVGGELVSVSSFKNHEGYNAETMINDIAIIKLATPVQKTSTVGFVELPSEPVKNGTDAIVTGWGTKCFMVCSSPVDLLEVAVKIIDQSVCSSDKYGYRSQITGSMICATEVKADACQGDSGGPLVSSDNKLVGVVSWGTLCASKRYPGVYTDVVLFRKWVEDAMASM